MAYSFVPAILACGSTSLLLFASPLTLPHTLWAFSSLMFTQLVNLQVDKKCVEYGMAPKWFSRYRGYTFAAYMACTAIMFLIYYC